MMARPKLLTDDDVRLNVRIPDDLLRKLKHACIEKDRSIKDAAKEAIEQWLRRK